MVFSNRIEAHSAHEQRKTCSARKIAPLLFQCIIVASVTSFSKQQFAERLTPIEELLRPIAKTPIDIADAAWFEKMSRVAPLDAAGVRVEAERLLQELIDAYAVEDDATRQAIRVLFNEFPSFAWATSPRVSRRTREGFRSHLLHFSILDQGTDPRDARVWLDAMMTEARQARLNVNFTLQEVAALSSLEDRYGWGSTHDWLIKLQS
jgi:hypothetical protein